MFPSECLLERSVRVGGDEDIDDTSLPFYILNCEDRKAEGYADSELEIYNKMLQGLVIGVRLAGAPPAVSYLVIPGARQFAHIAAVDRTVIVISLFTPYDAALSYLVYDSVASSLRMFPEPSQAVCTLTSGVCVAHPCRSTDYALVHMGRVDGEQDSLFLWRPSSLPPPPWSERKKADLPASVITAKEFSFNGHAYWVDVMWGVRYCSCDALFDDNISEVKFYYLGLPVGPGDYDLCIAPPSAYRTMGVVGDSFIRFVSVDGFEGHVKLQNRTVTVWKLLELDHEKGWEEEHKLSLETLWGFEGFGDMPKGLTPMYPVLSAVDTDVVYLALGEHELNRSARRFFPTLPRCLVAVDMQNKIVRTSMSLSGDDIVSCDFNRLLRAALDGPCDDEGIPMKKKRPIPMEEPRLEKLMRL